MLREEINCYCILVLNKAQVYLLTLRARNTMDAHRDVWAKPKAKCDCHASLMRTHANACATAAARKWKRLESGANIRVNRTRAKWTICLSIVARFAQGNFRVRFSFPTGAGERRGRGEARGAVPHQHAGGNRQQQRRRHRQRQLQLRSASSFVRTHFANGTNTHRTMY